MSVTVDPTLRRSPLFDEQKSIVVEQAHVPEDTLDELGVQASYVSGPQSIWKLDRDYTDGVEIIKAIKGDAELSSLPVMLVTNLAEHQDAAVALGAERGFGKLEYNRPKTSEKLQPILG